MPPELKGLSQEREAVIEREVSNLKDTLGPDLAARLDTYIHSHMAPKEDTEDLCLSDSNECLYSPDSNGSRCSEAQPAGAAPPRSKSSPSQ